jgi:CP family cyanate transporter-like MFS transporter
VSVPPLLATIRHDLGLSSAAAGLLTTLPVICMGLFAPAGALVASRLGRERALAGSLLLVAAGTLVRGFGAHVVPLYTGTLVTGVGIAVGTALLPGVVKAWFPDRAGAVTGLYTAALVGGALLAATLTVPLHEDLGLAWPQALAAWGLVAVAGLVVWVPVTRPVREPRTGRTPRVALPWRSGVAWRVSLFLGFQSVLYYTTMTWLPPLYIGEGWTARRAGLALAAFSLSQLVASLVIPALSDRRGDRRPWVLFCCVVTTVGLLLLALAPDAAPWTAAAVLGFGIGGQFALALSLLVDLAPSSSDAARLSGMAFLVGYLLASAGPVLAGVLHDASGGFRAPILTLVLVALVTVSLGMSVRPGLRV